MKSSNNPGIGSNRLLYSVKEPLYHPTASLCDTCYEETV